MVPENLYVVGHNTGVGGRVTGEETFPLESRYPGKGKGMYFKSQPRQCCRRQFKQGCSSPETQLRASASGWFFGAQSEQ